MTITDSRHPLFGRVFPVDALPVYGKNLLVIYQHQAPRIVLRIPLAATNLVAPAVHNSVKLTLPALEELAQLAKECELLCPCPLTPSGCS